jgi:large-conductance mechanosensitive channel
LKQKQSLKNRLLSVLRGEFMTFALKYILGSKYGSGIKSWVIAYLVTNLWDDIVEPLINAGLTEIKYIKHKIEGKITSEKIEKARREGNVQDYNDAVDSTLD